MDRPIDRVDSRSRCDRQFDQWIADHGSIGDDASQRKGAHMIFKAGWEARGNPWANLLGLIGLLALIAYWLTLIIHR